MLARLSRRTRRFCVLAYCRSRGCRGTATLVLLIGLLAGCATYRPKPIDALESARKIETRTLDDAGLRGFLEMYLPGRMPLTTWDFDALALAALYFHPDLELARASHDVARAAVITAGARPNPTISLTPQVNANSPSGVSPWTVGIGLDARIETASKRGHRLARAEQLAEAGRLGVVSAAWAARSRVFQAMVALDSAGNSLALLKQQLEIQAEIAGILEARLAAGEASLPDATLARIAASQAQLQVRDAEATLATSQVSMAEAVGVPVRALEGVSLSFSAIEGLPAADALSPGDARREALTGRSDVLALLAEYAATEAALQLEISRQYPDIQFGPGYQWDQGANKWSLGFTISLPILNRNEGPIAEAEARRREGAARFTALQARISAEVDRALAGYAAALAKLETARQVAESQLAQARKAEERFKAGSADRLELRSAELRSNAAALLVLGSHIGAEQALGRLEDALRRPMTGHAKLPPVSSDSGAPGGE